MPGVIYTLMLPLVTVLPILHLLIVYLNRINREDSILEYSNLLLKGLGILEKTPSVLLVGVFFIGLSFCYIVGTLFYRKDPKSPDYSSYIRIARKFKTPKELEDWVVKVRIKDWNEVQQRRDRQSIFTRLFTLWRFAAFKSAYTSYIDKSKDAGFIYDSRFINEWTVSREEIQFPYNNLRGYFEKRGWKRLAKLIHWELTDREGELKTDDISPRTKTFMNAIKIHLQTIEPDKCGNINKNEAHVRLSTSMWYVCDSLKRFAWLGFLFLVIAYMTSIAEGFYPDGKLLVVFLILMLVYTFANVFKRSSESHIHYQRIREIFYVMQTAVVVNSYSKHKIFVDDMEGNNRLKKIASTA